MLSMLRTIIVSCILFGIVSAMGNQHTIDIVENGMFIKETVTEYDDLHVYEVPQHGDRLHIITYLDFRSGLQMIKDVQNQRCQLSNMEQKQMLMRHVKLTWPESDGDGFTLPDLPVDGNSVEKVHLLKLEESEPMHNTSYLRLELQQACLGFPIYWADTFNEADMNSLTRSGVIEYDKDTSMILRAMNPEGNTKSIKSSSCNPTSTPSNQNSCHGHCTFQKCRVSSISCAYIITCPMNGMIGQTCLTHNYNSGYQCKMCCQDPKSPCQLTNGGVWQRCDCFSW